MHDILYAVRTFRRAPLFTIVAVFSLALAIGAGAAVFSVVDRILFRSLPYPHANRLVSLGFVAPIVPEEFMLGTDYLEWRARQTPFESITSWTGISGCDLTEPNPVRLACVQVEANFLSTLGIESQAGRNFTPEEDRPNGPKAAILSHALWESRFGGDPRIIGKTIPVDGQPARVAGVLPAAFELPTLEHADLLVPQALDPATQQRPNAGRVLRSIARLKPGISVQAAAAALQPLFQESLQFVPPQFRKEVSLQVRSLRDRQIHDARLASWILLGAVLAVLLIACANLANLLLARAATRRRELAVRLALGASRIRLARQALTESLMLAATGAAAGCALAVALLRVFITIAPEGIPRLQQSHVDLRVILAALIVSLACGIAFGLAPALQNARAETLAGWRAIGAPRHWFRQALVAAQICASLVLLTGASLLLRSLWNLENQPLGLRTDSVLTASVTLAKTGYSEPARRLAFFEALEARLDQMPGVVASAMSDSVPPAGPARSTIFAAINVRGHAPLPEGTGGMVTWRAVTPGYFATLGIPILRGRGFQQQDRDPHTDVVVVSQALARRLFPAEDALGKQIQPGRSGPWRTIIGVAGDVKNGGLAERGDPEFYVARKHGDANVGGSAYAVIRSVGNPQGMARWIRGEIAALDPTLPVDIQTLDQRIGELAQAPRFDAWLLSLFAGIGLLLAAIGLYGVVSFLVAQRTQEIGVRMALGATPAAVARLVLGHAARWTGAGAALGLLGSFFATRWLRAMLFGVSARDPFTLAVALGVLAAVALAAAWIPSRRAARVDPIQALRQD